MNSDIDCRRPNLLDSKRKRLKLLRGSAELIVTAFLHQDLQIDKDVYHGR